MFGLKSILSDNKHNYPALFWVTCVWTVFSYPFTLTVSVSLKWTSYREHVVGSCLFKRKIHPVTAYLWLKYSIIYIRAIVDR